MGMDRLYAGSNERCIKLLPPWAQWLQCPDPASSIWSTLALLCFACLPICAGQQTSPCPRKPLEQTWLHWGEVLPWWGSSQVIQSAPAEANQANQEAPRNLGSVQFVVSTLRHFLLLFLSFLWVFTGLVGGAATTGWGGLLLGTWRALCHSFHRLPALVSGIQVQERWTCGGNHISVCKALFLFPLAVLSWTRMKSYHEMMNEFQLKTSLTLEKEKVGE